MAGLKGKSEWCYDPSTHNVRSMNASPVSETKIVMGSKKGGNSPASKAKKMSPKRKARY